MTTLLHRLKGDRTIWMVALVLGLISLLAVYSSIGSLAFKKTGGNTFHFLLRHGLMLLTGAAIMYWASRVRYTLWSRLAQLALGPVAVLLLLTLLLGNNLNKASRWLEIPVIGQTFQTSDLAKVVLVLYLARTIGKHQGRPWTFRDVLLRTGLPMALVCGLILPANFSTAALLFAVCMAVMFIGRVPLKWMAALVGLAVGAFMLLVGVNEALDLGVLPRVDTWANRFKVFGEGGHEANYQVEHAKIAIARGGLLPNGPGSGISRNWLPNPFSDMIYAFIVEEYGSLFAGLFLPLLYLILLFRSLRIAVACPKPFGTLAAAGLGTMLTMQALVNMAVSVNLVPVTGQPMPLVSMGGTSIWFTCLAIGIIIGVSRALEHAPATSPATRQRRTTTDARPRTAIA